MLTTEQLQAIRERANKATPGPWVIAHGDDETGDEIYVFDEPSQVDEYPSYTTIAEEMLATDSRFIAHARENVPALLNYADSLIKENERLRGALERIANEQVDFPHREADRALAGESE